MRKRYLDHDPQPLTDATFEVTLVCVGALVGILFALIKWWLA